MYTFTHNGETLTPGYPEDRISYSKGMRAHSRISRRNSHSLKEDKRTQSQEVFVGDISTCGETLRSQTCCSMENQLSQGVSGMGPFYSLIGSEMCACHWLGPCQPTEGSCLSPSCHRRAVHDYGHSIPVGAWWLALTRGVHMNTATAGHNRCENKDAKTRASK